MGHDKQEVKTISDQDRKQYKDKIKVFVAQPTQGHIHYWAKDNHQELMFNLARLEAKSNYKFFSGHIGRLIVSYAREIIAERAIDGGMDYILWIDDDMLVPPDTFECLVRHDKDIVSALAFQRVPPFGPVIWKGVEAENKELSFDQIFTYPKDTLFKADAIGFGVVLTKVDFFKNMPKPWFMSTVPVGEDIWFSWKATKAGIDCYVDTSCKVKHIGSPVLIGEEEFKQYERSSMLNISYGQRVKKGQVMRGEIQND